MAAFWVCFGGSQMPAGPGGGTRCRQTWAAEYAHMLREQIVQLAAGSGSEISQPAGRRREGRN
jgi:hypothetical protein